MNPKLRLEILFEEVEDDCLVLIDPVTARVHPLNPEASFLARCFDGEHGLEEMAGLFQEHFKAPLERHALDAFVALMKRMHFLENKETRAMLPRFAERRKAVYRASNGLFEASMLTEALTEEAIGIRKDLRYACQACGACCTGRFRVQVMDDDFEVLEQLDLQGTLGCTLDEAVVVSYSNTRARRELFLRQNNGRCVFLGSDSLCELHRAFGHDQKPKACQKFPYAPLLTPEGGFIVYRPECSSQHKTNASGPLVAPGRAAIWDNITHPGMWLHALPNTIPLYTSHSTPLTYAEYNALEDRWSTATRLDWRSGLSLMAQALVPAGAKATRHIVRDVMVELARFESNVALPTSQFFVLSWLLRDTPDRLETDPLLMPALLYTFGIRSEDQDPETLPMLKRLAGAINQSLGALDGNPACQSLLNEYVTHFLTSKYLFHGCSIASGAGFLCTILLGARRLAAYLSLRYGHELDVTLLNESLICWHLLFLNKGELRGHLLLDAPQALEMLIALPAQVI